MTPMATTTTIKYKPSLSIMLFMALSSSSCRCRAWCYNAATTFVGRSQHRRPINVSRIGLQKQKQKQHQRLSAMFSSSTTDNDSRSNSSDDGMLDWESFDFSSSPKSDARFQNVPAKHWNFADANLDALTESDHEADEELQKELEERQRNVVDDDVLQKAINVILPFVSTERWEKIQSIVERRTQRTRFLFEHPSNPSNVFACLRTLDSFGIQHVDVVVQRNVLSNDGDDDDDQLFKRKKKVTGKAMLAQKTGMRTAMGSAKWMTVTNHLDGTREALTKLKQEGYVIVCTDVNPTSQDIRDINWAELLDGETTMNANDNGEERTEKRLCIVMGNEDRGISNVVRDMCDASIYLPMSGFAESFNLSVATAIVCAHLSADTQGQPLRPGNLNASEKTRLLFRGAVYSVNRRLALAIFRKQEGLKELGDPKTLSKLL